MVGSAALVLDSVLVSLRIGRYALVDSVRIFGFGSAGKVRKYGSATTTTSLFSYI